MKMEGETDQAELKAALSDPQLPDQGRLDGLIFKAPEDVSVKHFTRG